MDKEGNERSGERGKSMEGKDKGKEGRMKNGWMEKERQE